MTIKDIAKMAGVSVAAVSRYFNGGSLSDEKREIIQKIVEENNYVPNAMAQTMRTGKSGNIGVIVPRLDSESFAQIMAGIADEVEKINYTVILGVTDNKKEKEIYYIEQMEKSKMDGIILMGTYMTPHLKTTLEKCSIPIVVTGQHFKGVPSVFYDDKSAMYDITKLMLKSRKHIAFIGAPSIDRAAGKMRKEGVEKALEEAGIDKKSLIAYESDFTIDGGYETMKKILKSHKKVDGVICATDRMAHGAMLAIREAGKNIPDDISITGVGDSWGDKISSPQLTTVQLYYKKCGQTAVNLLWGLMKGESDSHLISKVMLGYSIIERGSV
ncbi:MAG: LacI family transcriptional regulator [Lachnospiraceae bacterium]|nr:LacI family transcriptional regulator [Lachnospiraceae bacterium]